MSLLSTLTEKLKNAAHKLGSSNAFKRIATIAAAGTIALSMSTLSACNFGSHTTTPGTNPGGEIVQPETPDNNPSNNPGTNSGTENLISQYSQILQNVLTGDYYKSVYNRYYNMAGSKEFGNEDIASNPYGFLKNEGYDIQSILDSKTYCSSNVYIKESEPNNLYISTKVGGTYNSTNYYTNYILNYSLTKKELEDLKMLHEGNYIQAPLFVQELTYQKKPVSYTKANIDQSFYKNITNKFNTDTTITAVCNNDAILDFINFDAENKTYDFNVRSGEIKNSYGLISEGGEIRYAHCKANVGINIIGNEIYSQTSTSCTILNKDEFLNTCELITYYSPANKKVIVSDGFTK